MATVIEVDAKQTPSPWRSRDFRLVWAGGLVNDIGDWLLMVALPLYVFTTTSSGLATAALFLVEMVPAILLGSVGGSLVDRWDLRRTLIVTNTLQAVALLPLLWVTPDRVWPAFGVAAVQSVLTRCNNPAKAALLPRLVGREALMAANSAGAMSDNLSRLVGSPLGGLLVSVGGLGTIVIADGVSFLVVAVAMWRVRWRPTHGKPERTTSDRSPRGSTDRSTHRDLREGIAVIRRTRPLPALMVTLGLAQVAQGLFLVLFIAFVVRRLGASVTDVGVIRGLQAVGGIPGAVIVGRFASRAHPGRVAGLGFAGMALCSFIAWNGPALTTAVVFYAVMFVAAGTPAVATGAGSMTAAQLFAPPGFIGRVVGTGEAVGAAGSAIGLLAGGALVDHVRLSVLLNAQASIYGTCALICLLVVARAPRPDAAITEAELTPSELLH